MNKSLTSHWQCPLQMAEFIRPICMSGWVAYGHIRWERQWWFCQIQKDAKYLREFHILNYLTIVQLNCGIWVHLTSLLSMGDTWVTLGKRKVRWQEPGWVNCGFLVHLFNCSEFVWPACISSKRFTVGDKSSTVVSTNVWVHTAKLYQRQELYLKNLLICPNIPQPHLWKPIKLRFLKTLSCAVPCSWVLKS